MLKKINLFDYYLEKRKKITPQFFSQSIQIKGTLLHLLHTNKLLETAMKENDKKKLYQQRSYHFLY